MMQQEQLGQPQNFGPPPVFMSAFPKMINQAGLGLGNALTQGSVLVRDVDLVIELYQTMIMGAAPRLRLEMLKRRKFREEGRQGRIAMSLAALNAPQPTELTPEQWKAVLAEEEDED